MTSAGSGYTSAPTVSFTGGGGTGASASAATQGPAQGSQGPVFAEVDINHDGCISKNEFPFPAGEAPVFEDLAGLSQADGDCVADQISLADFQAFTTAYSSGSEGPVPPALSTCEGAALQWNSIQRCSRTCMHARTRICVRKCVLCVRGWSVQACVYTMLARVCACACVCHCCTFFSVSLVPVSDP